MTMFNSVDSFPSVLDTPDDAPPATPAAEPATAEAEPATAEAAPDGFAELGLPRPLVRALARAGIERPFPIQTATIPDALAGRDVLGRGQTGSGKTMAFGLPVLARMAGTPTRAGAPRALILVPTRELAMQVADALRPLARALDVFVTTAVGGVPYDRQIQSLRRGVHILVATPGRLDDLIQRGDCALDRVEVAVLDEADRMADMGFLPEVTALLERTPAGGQRLLFSATLDGDVDTLVSTFMSDPVTHSMDEARAAVSTMDHRLLLVPPNGKFEVLASIAARRGRTILFARTQAAVDRLVEQLGAVGVPAGALHGGKTQRVRTRTLAEFREGEIDVLVATDVAARGIHVDGVSLVVHVDPPKDPKDYLHRAGRTARAGEAGTVVTLVLPRQRRSVEGMLDRAGVTAGSSRVRAGDAELAELTGAREPSGVPVPPRDYRPRPARGDGRPRGRGRFPAQRDTRTGDHRRGERGDRHGHGESGHRYGDRHRPGDRGRDAGRPPRRAHGAGADRHGGTGRDRFDLPDSA
jgi:superfamily II DNA/RNA helicase